jgi:hypothetical protein
MPDFSIDEERKRKLREDAALEVSKYRDAVSSATMMRDNPGSGMLSGEAASRYLEDSRKALDKAVRDQAELETHLSGSPEDVHEFLRKTVVDHAREDAESTADMATFESRTSAARPEAGMEDLLAQMRQQQQVEDAQTDYAEERAKGCAPATIAIIGAVIAAVVGLAYLIFGIGDSSKPDTAASSTESPSGMDGHWVLVSGLKDTYRDMPASCSHVCDGAGEKLTIDQPQAEIDISGTKITGGKNKVGFTSALAGDKCSVSIESKLDATVSGGVDLNHDYGTLLIDGKATGFHGCDSSLKPLPINDPGHLSRFIYLKADTLYLCYNLVPAFDACSDPASGSAATFRRE